MNLRKVSLSAIALIAFTSTVFAQKDVKSATTKIETQKIPIDPNVRVGKLDNGLTYYIRNNGKPEDKVELRLAVNAGSILEDDNQVGLAHFMEHMNFNGTKNFQKNELVDYLQSIGVKFGADLNAYTSFDETVYILPIPSDDPEKLEKGFQIVEDWAHNATLTDEQIDSERGVVLEEYRLGLGPDKRMMQDYLPKLLYGSKYAERLPIGTKENLENFTYEDVRSYYRDYYRPDLMAVVAVGDLDVAVMEAKIKSHFGKIKNPKTEKKRPIYELPNHAETFISIASDKEAPFSRVQVVYKDRINAAAILTVAEYKEQLTKNLFSTMINNRLNELRNSANPPFVFGFSYYGGTYARSKNAYQSIAQTSETGQLDGLKALLEANERVKRFGFQEGEYDRAKQELLAQLEKQYNDRDKIESGRIVGEYVNNFLQQEPIPGITWEFETTKKLLPVIQLADINNLISQFLHDDNRVIILTGPEKEGLTQVTEAQVSNLLKEVETMEIEPYADTELKQDLIENLKPAGTIQATEMNKTLGTTTLTLSNGAKVTYKKTDFKNDEVLFEAFSYGGSSLYSDQDYKATVFANNGLAEAGFGGISINDLGKMMSGKIVNVRPSIQNLTENFSGSAAPKDLEILFQQVYSYFTALNKDDEAFNSYISKQKSFLGNLMANPQFYFQDQLGKFKNQGNDRYVGFPTVEDMDKADYDLAYKLYQERFADAGDFHFYFVGNVDEKQLENFSKKYLASLPGLNSNEKFNATKYREADTPRRQVFNKGKDPKSLVTIAWHEDDVKYSDKDAMAIDALGEVLTIKLIEKLREEEGGVYGVGARGSLSKISFPQANFSISFPCGPENVDKLVTAALGEVERLKAEGPSDKDLAKVKETYLVENKDDLKKNAFWINALEKAGTDGTDPLEILKTTQEVNSLTKQQIQDAAKKYLDENYLLGILMPEEK